MMEDSKIVKYYDFDLSSSASQRWGPIFDEMMSFLPSLKGFLDTLLKPYQSIITASNLVFNFIDKNKILHYDEIRYIASRMGYSDYQTVLLQLIYEVSSACTTTVIEFDNKKFYFRTMDWAMPILGKATIGLNIIKNGVKIGQVVTWLGYVGYLTATSILINNSNNNSINNILSSKDLTNYKIAINYRRTQEISIMAIANNVLKLTTGNWPVGYLVREVIDKNLGLTETLDIFRKALLVTPCYIFVYNPSGASTVFTRDSDKVVDERQNQLIQTNCDHDKTCPNILYSLERRELIKNLIKKLDSSDSKPDHIVEQILESLLVHPIINETTIYYVYHYYDCSTSFSRESGVIV